MFAPKPFHRAFGPSFLINSVQATSNRTPVPETLERSVSIGCVKAVPHIDATEPPNMRSPPLKSFLSSSPFFEDFKRFALNESYTKNSTAFVGAILNTFNEFPLKSAGAPSVRIILFNEPRTPPSAAIFEESNMYSIFTLSNGATNVLETPPEIAPTSKCNETAFA